MQEANAAGFGHLLVFAFDGYAVLVTPSC